MRSDISRKRHRLHKDATTILGGMAPVLLKPIEEKACSEVKKDSYHLEALRADWSRPLYRIFIPIQFSCAQTQKSH